MKRPLAVLGSLAAAASVLLLAGCGTPPPQPNPDPVPAAPPPVVTTDQANRIYTDVGAAVTASDKALSTKDHQDRIADPAARMLDSQYKIAAAKVPDFALPQLPFDHVNGMIIADTNSWPRYFLVANAAPAGNSKDTLPRVYLLEQETARSNYQLWGWGRVMPGESFPKTEQATVGSQPLSLTDTTALVASPNDVLAHYADLMTKGDKSAYAKDFADDDLRAANAQLLKVNQEAFTQENARKGSASMASTVLPDDGAFAIRTADGGALVVGSLQTQLKLTLEPLPEGYEGGKVTLPAIDAALAGKSDFSSEAVMNYDDIVMFAVPPAGSSDKISLVAAEQLLVSATAN